MNACTRGATMKREEIKILFDEAANGFAMLSGLLSRCEEHEEAKKKFNRAKYFGVIAEQINNMRCDTCAKGVYQVIGFSCPWRGCGGCFQHEAKVAG